MVVQCGTVTVLYIVTLYVGSVDNWACYDSAVCFTDIVLYCVTLYDGAVDNWVCYGSAVWYSYSAVLCDNVCWCCR